MRTMLLIILSLTVLSCSFLVSRNMRDIVSNVDGFTLDNITENDRTLDIGTLIGGNQRIFVEFGADSTLVGEFSRFEDRLTVETVSFQSLKGAIGAFKLTELPGAYPIDIGYLGRRNDTTVQTVQNEYIITVKAKNTAGMPAAEELTRSLAKRITAPVLEPDIYSTLPENSRVQDSESFFMGSRSFGMQFPAPLAEDLSISLAREGWAARYKPGDLKYDLTLFKIRFPSTIAAVDAVNNYLAGQRDRPVILPRESLQYYTVIDENRLETYIANYADWLYFLPSCPPDGDGRDFFEYLLRGGR